MSVRLVHSARSAVAVRTVRAGDALLAPAITRRLVERFARRGTERPSLHRALAALSLRARARAVVVAYETGLVSPGSYDNGDGTEPRGA